MDTDLIIDIRPGEEPNLVLEVGGTGLPPGQQLVRKCLDLDAAQIQELRSGVATEAVSTTLAEKVSKWLLDTDFGPLLEQALHRNQSLRVVFRTSQSLAEKLADVPFELIELTALSPLALSPSVQSIIHALPKVGPARSLSGLRTWPLRVLIVRSNPQDLGGAVPEAAPIREEILGIARERYGEKHIQVTVLSSEPGIPRPATWEELRKELGTSRFDILVFLGHGSLIPAFTPVGALQFEGPDGYSQSVDAAQLRAQLDNSPVPVVILAGCLTAAALDEENRNLLRQKFPEWMRASQGVAQSLVNSEAGVQLALGMRYRLETDDARQFLQAFFRSLLLQQRGNVEAAVRAGRLHLYTQRRYPPSWAAPVIFRALGPEPLFEFLTWEPSVTWEPSPEDAERDKRDQDYRVIAWNSLSRRPRSMTAQLGPGTEQTILQFAEKSFRERAQQQGVAVLMPGLAMAVPGEEVRLPIELVGPLSVERLEARLVFDKTVSLLRCRPSEQLKAAGFRLLTDQQETPGELHFHIEHKSRGQGAAPLPQGPLFHIDCTVATQEPMYLETYVDAPRATPHVPVRGWRNAIVLSPP
jgi:hypothetical protein